MSNRRYETVGEFESEAALEKSLADLERSGLNYKRLLKIRSDDPGNKNEFPRLLRKCIAAGALLGGLIGSWTGKAAILFPPIAGLWGKGQAGERWVATVQCALLAGGLGALLAVLTRLREKPGRSSGESVRATTAAFRIDVRGTAEERSKAHAVLSGRH